MIVHSYPRWIAKFVRFLNAQKPQYLKEAPLDCAIVVLPKYSHLETEHGHGRAVYIPELHLMMVPSKMLRGRKETRRDVLLHIAHEYCHHLQECAGRKPLEREAEKYARETVKDYERKGR